jgi:hypothetical protein
MVSVINTSNKCQVLLGDNLYEIPQKNSTVLDMFKDFHNMENLAGFLIIKLDSDTFHDTIFMKLLGNISDFATFDQIISLLKTGDEYFKEMEISISIKSRIEKWIDDIGNNSQTWTELTEKPNYGLELMKKRFWPYFSVECKDWQSVALNNINGTDYPHQSDDTVSSDILLNDNISKDYKLEFNISQKYNNYLGYAVLDPNDYPNLEVIINILKCIESLNLVETLFVAVSKILTNPSMCHIIKDIEFWNIINPYLKNPVYNRLVIYYMYYSMFIMNHEYLVMFSQVKRDYRIIFTHQEALAMPLTYMYHHTIDPYIQQLTGDQFIIESVPYYLRCKRYIQPVDVFERRFYLATGGALANIPLYKYNAAVSGSILIPCISYSELEDAFEGARFDTSRLINHGVKYNQNIYTHNSNDDTISKSDMDFISYLEYYYPSYYSLSSVDYIKKVLTFVEDIPRSVSDEKDEIDNVDIIKYNLLSDIDISITTDNFDTFEVLSNMLILQIQKNCLHIGKVWSRKIYTKSSFKYKVYGPGLMRPIDLFRVPCDPAKMVKKFHCPIVRAWYNGSNSVIDDLFDNDTIIDTYWKSQLQTNPDTWEDGDLAYSDSDDDDDVVSDLPTSNMNNPIIYIDNYKGINILLSCVFAILSGVNNNYKWFFNSKPCVEVILKYAQRGFTTLINQREKNALLEYMKESPKWKHFIPQIFKNFKDLDKSIDMFGQVNKLHIFFSPCISETGIRYNLRQFKTMNTRSYSRNMYVGMLKSIANGELNVDVKTNTKVYSPDMKKIDILNKYKST